VKTKNKKRHAFIQRVAIGLIVIGVSVLFIPFRGPKSGSPPTINTFTTVGDHPVLYTLAEMQAFWKTHCDEACREQLPNNRYHIPEVQERYNLLCKKINEKYGKIHRISASPIYARASKDITAGAVPRVNDPEVVFFVPAMVDCFHQRKNAGGKEDEMKYTCVVGYIHELEHLAWEKPLEFREENAPLDALVESERVTWDLTCRFTIAPLIERYGAPIGPSDRGYYENWVKSGCNSESPEWERFIRGQYRRTR